LSREDILAVYENGPEAVVSLVQTLCSITNKQAARIAELEERKKALEDQINKNSRNSSKPPSTDTFRKIKGQRKPSGKPCAMKKRQVTSGVRYLICRLSTWKYSSINLKARSVPIADASTKQPFPKKLPIRFNMELV